MSLPLSLVRTNKPGLISVESPFSPSFFLTVTQLVVSSCTKGTYGHVLCIRMGGGDAFLASASTKKCAEKWKLCLTQKRRTGTFKMRIVFLPQKEEFEKSIGITQQNSRLVPPLRRKKTPKRRVQAGATPIPGMSLLDSCWVEISSPHPMSLLWMCRGDKHLNESGPPPYIFPSFYGSGRHGRIISWSILKWEKREYCAGIQEYGLWYFCLERGSGHIFKITNRSILVLPAGKNIIIAVCQYFLCIFSPFSSGDPLHVYFGSFMTILNAACCSRKKKNEGGY